MATKSCSNPSGKQRSNPRGNPRRIEAAIQRALVKWIAQEYPHIMVQATLNEMARKHVDMGVCVGIPDLLLFEARGSVLRVFFLELKTTKGTLSESQKEWLDLYLEKYKSSNTEYAVAYGFNAAKGLIKLWIEARD